MSNMCKNVEYDFIGNAFMFYGVNKTITNYI